MPLEVKVTKMIIGNTEHEIKMPQVNKEIEQITMGLSEKLEKLKFKPRCDTILNHLNAQS